MSGVKVRLRAALASSACMRVMLAKKERMHSKSFNLLAHNDVFIRRTAQLTILNIYSTNILTEYFKHAVHSPLFFLSLFKMRFIS